MISIYVFFCVRIGLLPFFILFFWFDTTSDHDGLFLIKPSWFRHKHTGITGHSHFRRTGAEAHLFTHSSRLYRCLSHSVTFLFPIIVPFALLTVVLCFLDSQVSPTQSFLLSYYHSSGSDRLIHPPPYFSFHTPPLPLPLHSPPSFLQTPITPFCGFFFFFFLPAPDLAAASSLGEAPAINIVRGPHSVC